MKLEKIINKLSKYISKDSKVKKSRRENLNDIIDELDLTLEKINKKIAANKNNGKG